MFLYQWANRDSILYRVGYSWHMHKDWKIVRWEMEHLNKHIQVANCRFRTFEITHCHHVAQLAFQVEMVLVVVYSFCVGGEVVHPFLCTSRVCKFFAVPAWQRRHLFVWFWRSKAGCLCIAAFPILCPRNSTPSFFSLWTAAQGILISYWVSSIAAQEIPALPISAILKARGMSNCSSWAQHQQKTFPSGRTGCVRVDALRQSRQRHPGGGLLRAWRQYHASSCISPSDRRFAVSSCSVGLLF